MSAIEVKYVLESRRDEGTIAQQFIAGNQARVYGLSPVGTTEIQSSLRDSIKLSAYLPSNKLLGYCQSLLSELKNMQAASRSLK